MLGFGEPRWADSFDPPAGRLIPRRGIDLSQRIRIEAGAQPFPGVTLKGIRGRGGYAEVWEARAADGRRVALKFMQSANSGSTVREMKALEVVRRLDHPHVLRLYDTFCVPGYVVVSMELADGSLLDLLDASVDACGTMIAPELLCTYFRQAGKALDYLNARKHNHEGRACGYQHCDVKPSNLLLVGEEVKLADFGFCTPTFGPQTQYQRAGTLDFTAPEVHRGVLTDRSDQYGLAVSYYYLLHGRLPVPAAGRVRAALQLRASGRRPVDGAAGRAPGHRPCPGPAARRPLGELHGVRQRPVARGPIPSGRRLEDRLRAGGREPMLTPFLAAAMASPGRQASFRRAAVVHVGFVAGLAWAVTSATDPDATAWLGHALLAAGIVEGATLVGWRLTQLPKSQALEFLLVSPLPAGGVFAGEALAGLGRLFLVTLAALPVLLLATFAGRIAARRTVPAAPGAVRVGGVHRHRHGRVGLRAARVRKAARSWRWAACWFIWWSASWPASGWPAGCERCRRAARGRDVRRRAGCCTTTTRSACCKSG